MCGGLPDRRAGIPQGSIIRRVRAVRSKFLKASFGELEGTPSFIQSHSEDRKTEIQCISDEEERMSTTMVHVRIDQGVKDRATKALATMGLSVSDAVRMMLVRVAAEDALPFDVRVPNATTVKAMEAADRREGRRFSSAEALLKDLGI